MEVAERPQSLEESGRRRHHAHVAGDGLDNDGGDLPAAPRHDALDRGKVVERHGRGQRRQGRGNAQAVRQSEGRAARARLDQQAVGVAVIAALELENDIASRGASREPDGAHGRLGAGGNETRHLH